MDKSLLREQLVYFDGAWPADEYQRVLDAIEKTEAALRLPIPHRLFGKAWICSRWTGHQGQAYVVGRAHLKRIVHASAFEELLTKIQRLGEQRTDTADTLKQGIFYGGLRT